MNASYRRNYNRSYMILENDEDRVSFEEKMIQHNRLKSLLILQIMTSDEKRQFWYDITGRASLKSYMDYEKLGFREMENLLQHLIYAVEEAREYLLDPGHILLSAEGIFFDRNTLTPSFAYFPFEERSFPEGIRELFDELLRNMDHEDAGFVSVMYEIYGKILNDNFTLEETLDILKAHAPHIEDNDAYDPSASDMPQMIEAECEPKRTVNRKNIAEADRISDLDEYDLEIPKAKPRKIIFFSNTKCKKAPRANKPRTGKKKKDDDLVMYVGEEEAVDDGRRETVLLTGSFLSSPEYLRYSGSHALPDLCIAGDSVTVGSAAEQNDEVIDSPAVSKHHARITRNSGKLFLEDLNSTNGTYVNGEPLNYREKRLLKKNDKIHFADEMFVLQ